MTNKIKIYCDTGADIDFLKYSSEKIEFIQFPYDSSHRSKKVKMPVANPSASNWYQVNITWQEAIAPWTDYTESTIYSELEKIIGKQNKEDILHLDSAYKTGAHLFLTSDKRDIWSKRSTLESICGFKIFYPATEKYQIIECVTILIQSIENT